MMVDNTKTSSGSPTEIRKISAAKIDAGNLYIPSGELRLVAPFPPTVTNLTDSRTSRASINSEMMPINMIAPARTAATPLCRDEMLR